LIPGLYHRITGENAEVLTYSEPSENHSTGELPHSEKKKRQRKTGCVDKFCSRKIANKEISKEFESCDEVCVQLQSGDRFVLIGAGNVVSAGERRRDQISLGDAASYCLYAGGAKNIRGCMFQKAY
jgi:hypothetical protein